MFSYGPMSAEPRPLLNLCHFSPESFSCQHENQRWRADEQEEERKELSPPSAAFIRSAIQCIARSKTISIAVSLLNRQDRLAVHVPHDKLELVYQKEWFLRLFCSRIEAILHGRYLFWIHSAEVVLL